MKKAVLYIRVSRSKDESVSLARQEAELRELCQRENWAVAAVVEDDGITGTRERENAEAALAMVASGEADVLVSWELSRWSRMGLSAVAKLVAVLDERPSALLVFHKEGLRSSQPAFGIMAAVIAEVARMEAQGTRDRILSMRAYVLGQTAPEDQRWLGGKCPVGYKAVPRPDGKGKRLVVDEEAARHLREVARRLIAGHTLTEVTQYLTDNLPTPQSKGPWRISTVRKLMQSPTLLGRTTQKVEVGKRVDGSPIIEYHVVTDAQGLPIQRWDPVLDAGTFAAVQERFYKKGPNQPRKAASWLSGFMICALCGSVMYANSRKNRAVDTFRCSNRAIPGQACPGVSISRKVLEDYMESVILGMIGSLKEYTVTERIEGPDLGSLDDVGLAIADVQRALAADGADYGVLLPQLDALKAERRRLVDSPARVVRKRVPTGRTLAEAWVEGTIPQRQYIISDMLDCVKVSRPRVAGKAGRIEDRIEEVWIDPVAEPDD
ncbi:recombinase family protein [Microbacterium azadirachtae]|uniref:Site-specific DNA recombinase n=1 Tax=Microbacterium azadirachtae TaxID=582680 RepID=A0A0F0LFI9_9MICO|nr:recombinase family protein [Microbacterium azadirachtae]KJL31898.1 hypothetical protein RS86_03179 [Microbacterium azadirachtae]